MYPNDRVVFNNVSAVSINAVTISAGNLFSGTYTPTISDLSNYDSVTPFQSQYMRVGNVVTVSGRVSTDPISAAAASFKMTLPIASDITASTNVAGGLLGDNHNGQIFGDATNNKANANETPGIATVHDMYFTFTYLIQ